jgi:hypothetical protein
MSGAREGRPEVPVRVSLAVGLLLALSLPALAQPTGGLAGALDGELPWDDGIVAAARPLVADGDLAAADVDALVAAAGQRVSAREGGTILGVVERRVEALPAYEVGDEARARVVRAGCVIGLSPASRAAVAAGKTYAGTRTPEAVREALARARLNGAVAYDVTETNAEGEGVYSEYPSVTPATENMRFGWTEVTPAALDADLQDTRPRLLLSGTESVTVDGEELSVVRYTRGERGTGSIAASYDEAFHAVDRFDEAVRAQLGYPEWMRGLQVSALREARSSSGDRWASNCAILADGSIHCLPAARRHSSEPGLILTNPALARGKQLLWHGHLTAEAGVITSVGTAGRMAKRVAEGKDVLVNPVTLLRAWGFQLAPALEVRSEHATARHVQDDARGVLRQPPPG